MHNQDVYAFKCFCSIIFLAVELVLINAMYLINASYV